MTGSYWGYDPGGNDAHGLAQLDVLDGRSIKTACFTAGTVGEAIETILSQPKPLGLGIDTLTAWSLGSAGWRLADHRLREEYLTIQNSVISPNALFGSMAISGMALLLAVREKWPELTISETHPKVVYFALTQRKYQDDDRSIRTKQLMRLPEFKGTDFGNPQTDDEWDAVLGAHCVRMGVERRWTLDLHETAGSLHVIHPAGPTSYFWPKRIP